MMGFLLRRSAGLALVLLTMTLIVFMLQQVVPTDPVRALVGPNAPAAAVEQQRAALGLDQPVMVQYGHYVWRLAHGDFGRSIRTGRPVRDDLASFLPASIELMLAAALGGSCIGVVIAVAETWLIRGQAAGIILTALGSAPIFLAGFVLLIIFWLWLGWLPSGGRLDTGSVLEGDSGLFVLDALLSGTPGLALQALRHLVLPAATLALPFAVAISRTLRAALVGVMRQNYVRTAFSKGLSRLSVIRLHGLRNAAQAPVAMAGLQIGLMFSNILIVERIFAWPGLGLYLTQAFASADLPAILGASIAFGALYVVVNLAVDLIQIWLDPRLAAT
jgi:peptide/nickel transport system permease protein/dipeptide transport system permease protein